MLDRSFGVVSLCRLLHQYGFCGETCILGGMPNLMQSGKVCEHSRIGGIARQRFSWYLDGLQHKYTNPSKRDAQNDAIVFEAHFGKKMIP